MEIGIGLSLTAANILAGTSAEVPAAFAGGEWGLFDALASGADGLLISITALPADGGAAITALEYRVGGGAAIALLGTGGGVRFIAVPAATLASVEVRAVNSAGAGPWSAAKTATPTAGTALSFRALSDDVFTRPSFAGATWAAAGTTITAALAALDANTAPFAAISTVGGATATAEADGGLTYDPTTAYAGLADGATATDTFIVMETGAAGELIGKQRDVTFGGLTQNSATAYTKTTAVQESVTYFFNAAGGYLRRLAADQTINASFTATLTGGANKRFRLRVQTNAVVYADVLTGSLPDNVATPVSIDAIIPAGTPVDNLRVFVTFFDAAPTGNITGLTITGKVSEAATVTANLLGGALVASNPAFSVTDAQTASGDTLYLQLDPAWIGWSAGRVVRYRVGGSGSGTVVGLAGLHEITGLTPDSLASVEVSGDDGATWSAAQTATPTARSLTTITVFADRFSPDELAATTTHVGETVAATASVNSTFALADGSEMEHVGGNGSPFVVGFGYVDQPLVKAPGAAITGSEVNLPEPRWRFYEPAAAHLDLAPLAVRAVTYKLRVTGDGADQDATIRVLGSCGSATQESMSAFGLDADGDPVEFLFDRQYPVGKLLDGRPYVVAPSGVRLLANGGQQTVAAGKVATWQGASLCVVSAAGQVPHETVAVTLTTAYQRPAGAFTFTGWPASAGGSAALLKLSPNLAEIHVELNVAGSGVAQVRFRKNNAGNWMPGDPLQYDSRELVAPAFGQHRGTIFYLEPGVWTVQVLKDGVSYEGTATVLGLKVPKTAQATPAAVSGVVTLATGGSAVEWKEYTPPPITGALVIDADYVIVRDPRVFCAPQHAIQIAAGRSHVRIVRPVIRGWGRDIRARLGATIGTGTWTTPGWGENHDAAISYGNTDDTSADIHIIGAHIGAPRRPTNCWQEWNPGVGDELGQPGSSSVKWTYAKGNHPWGPVPVWSERINDVGPFSIRGMSVVGHDFRTLHDGIIEGQKIGANHMLTNSFTRKFTDDALEYEGDALNCGAINVMAISEVLRPYMKIAPGGVGLTDTTHLGPFRGDRIAILRVATAYSHFLPNLTAGANNPMKAIAASRADSKLRLYNSTAWTQPNGASRDDRICHRDWFTNYEHVSGANNLNVNNRRFDTDENSETGAVWDASNQHFQTPSGAPVFTAPGEVVVASGAISGVELANVTDGGPWADETPIIGAGLVA